MKKRTYNSFIKAFMDGVDTDGDTHINRMTYLRNIYFNKYFDYRQNTVNRIIDIMFIDTQIEAMSKMREIINKHGEESLEYNAIIFLLTGKVKFRYLDI